MADLAAQSVNGEITLSSISAASTYANDERTLLLVKVSASGRVVTVSTNRTAVTVAAFGTLTVSNIAVTSTGSNYIAIQAPPASYNNTTNGKASFTMNTYTSTTAAAIRLNNIS